METSKQYLPLPIRYFGIFLCILILGIIGPIEYKRIGGVPWMFLLAISIPLIIFSGVTLFHTIVKYNQSSIVIEYYPIYKKIINIDDIKNVTSEGRIKSPLTSLGFIGIKLNGPHTTLANKGGELISIETTNGELIKFTIEDPREAMEILKNIKMKTE